MWENITEMYRRYSRVYGTDEYFESGEKGSTTYILPPNIGGNNVFFPIVISKVWGQPPPVPLHRNSTVKYILILNYKLRKANNYMYWLCVTTQYGGFNFWNLMI